MTKCCPICGLNIVDAYFDKHISKHSSKSAEEHAKAAAAQRVETERRAKEAAELKARWAKEDAEYERIAEENRQELIRNPSRNRYGSVFY